MRNKYNNFRLLIVSKSPELGRVKTRMQPGLSKEESVQLHIALTLHCLQKCLASKLCSIDLWVGGDMECFKKNIGYLLPSQYKYGLYPQVPGNIGDKMSAAFRVSLQTQIDSNHSKGILLLGTDCPFIDKGYLLQAIEYLDTKCDVVIGPVNDGGYVLLGMKQYHPTLFENINWGSDSVFADTVLRIQQLGLSYQTLPYLSDIDTVNDLPLLAEVQDSISLMSFAIKTP
ncbi:MAG: rSAM/selenodomain-associated transferase 1 [Candidatus Endobugula sp.]|jgi:rSAM/selenodomain-associated transferase 1